MRIVQQPRAPVVKQLHLPAEEWTDVPAAEVQAIAAATTAIMMKQLSSYTTMDAHRFSRFTTRRPFRVDAVRLKQCRNKQLRGLLPLAGLRSLRGLDLSGNGYLSDIAPLAHCSRLARLSLRGTAVFNLSPLRCAR